MVAPAVTLLNANKPNQNGIDPGHPGNSFVIKPRPSLLVNPNYRKLTNRRPNTNYNINVHYSTNLTHPELAPQSPLQNPVLERTRTLSPVQKISVIGRGTDPSVSMGGSHMSHYVRVKEEPTRTQTSKSKTSNIDPEAILGPFADALINKDTYYKAFNNLEEAANDILKVINDINIFGGGLNLENAYFNFNFPATRGIDYNYIKSLYADALKIENELSAIRNSFSNAEIENLLNEVKQTIQELSTVIKTIKSTPYYDLINSNIFQKYINAVKTLGNVANKILKLKDDRAFEEWLKNTEYETLEQFAKQVAQFTGGLSLSEIFQILGHNIYNWIPHNNSHYGEFGASIDSANMYTSYYISAVGLGSGPQLVLEYRTGSMSYGNFSESLTYQWIEIRNINGYVVIKYIKNVTVGSGSSPNETNYIKYYVIDPKTGKVIYESKTVPEIVSIAKPPTTNVPTQGDVAQPSQVISNVLQQYGYQLTQQELQEIDNLQKGQSVTIQGLTPVIITYLGNNQYQIQTEGNPFTPTGQEVGLNLTVTIPTYNINQQTGQISTTNLSISGTVTTSVATTSSNGIAEIFPYQTETYNVNETIPINYTVNGSQITFQTGNPQGGTTLQSTSLPTLTYQQYIELANGQMPPGIGPGWYYYPTLNEFVYVAPPQYTLTVGNTQITNQQVVNFVQQYGSNNVYVVNMPGNSNELAFIYLNPSGNGQMLIYNTSTGQVVNTTSVNNLNAGNLSYDLLVQSVFIQQYSKSKLDQLWYGYSQQPIINTTIQYLSDIWNGLTSIGQSSNNTLNLNYQQLANEVLYGTSSGNTTTQASNSSNANLQSVLYGSSLSPASFQIQIVPLHNVTSISNYLYYQQLFQQIENNPYYPFNTSTVKIKNLTTNTIPTITDTTMTWNQIQYETSPQYRTQIEQTKNEVQNWEWGIQTYNFYSDLASMLGLKESAQYYQNLAQQAQIYGSPAFYQAEQLGQTERLITASIISSLPFSIAGVGISIADVGAEVGAEGAATIGAEEVTTAAGTNMAMPTLGSFIKNFLIQGSAITGLTNAISYFTTGKLLSPEEDLFLFTTAGLTAAGTSLLGSLLSRSLTNIGITGLKSTILTDLTQNVISQAGINTEVQEVLSLQNKGKWLSPSEAEQAAISGAEMGAFFTPIDIFMEGVPSSFLRNPLSSSFAAGTINALFMLPSGNPELIASAFSIGFATHGLDRLITFSKVPYLLESPEVQRVLDTTEAGWRLERDLKDRMTEAGLVTEEDTVGWTTTQTIQKLTEIYNNLQEKIIEKELSPQDKVYLRLNGILGIRDDIIQGKEEDFAKYIRDKVPDGEKYYQAQQTLKDLGKKLDKMFKGWKVNLNLGNDQRTLFYFMKSGDEYTLGFGSAGKEESFISRRSVNDITLNVAGIYNTPSDVIDTIKYLRSKGMYEDAEMLERIYKAVSSIKDRLAKIKPSRNIEIEFRDYAEEYAKKYGFEYGELISTQMGDTIKEYIQEKFGKNAVIYGSESVRQYLDNIAKMYGGKVVRAGKEYAIIDRYGNIIWKFRMPGDVDVIINTKDPGVLEKAAEDIAKLLNKTLNTNRFVAQEHLVIDKYRDGEHVVDLHMPNEGSEWKNVYARLSNFYDLGFPRPEPYYRDNIGVASLSQTLLDKTSAVASLRQLSLHDIVDAINKGEKIDNPEYIISFLKDLLKNADYETQRNVLSEFIGNLNPGRRNVYLYLISKEFGIPMEKLTYIDPNYWNAIHEYFYKKVTYIAPATYRLKDTGDTLRLIYLGGKLNDFILDRIPPIGRNIMKDYERIKQISKGKGILEKDWTEPNEINMEDVFKSLNPFKSNTESTKTVRVGSAIGSAGSLFESSITKPSSISSVSSSSSISNKSSSITSTSLSTSRSTLNSMSSESLSSSLTSSSLSSSISSSLSNSTSLSSSISASMSSSLSSSISQSSSLSSSLSTSISTSTSTSLSLSPSTSESVSVSVSTSNPWQFAFLEIGKPKHESSATQPELGKAKTSMSDAAYAFNKIWR